MNKKYKTIIACIFIRI